EQVLSAADSDPWRRGLRAARARPFRPAQVETLKKLAAEVDAAAQPPEELFLMHMALHTRGNGAVALLRRAQEAFPGDFWINHDLGFALLGCQPPRNEEAVRFLTAAVALRPESAGARLNLGAALSRGGHLDEAAAAYHQAIRLQ